MTLEGERQFTTEGKESTEEDKQIRFFTAEDAKYAEKRREKKRNTLCVSLCVLAVKRFSTSLFFSLSVLCALCDESAFLLNFLFSLRSLCALR
jgi:hypothetical protein